MIKAVLCLKCGQGEVSSLHNAYRINPKRWIEMKNKCCHLIEQVFPSPKATKIIFLNVFWSFSRESLTVVYKVEVEHI